MSGLQPTLNYLLAIVAQDKAQGSLRSRILVLKAGQSLVDQQLKLWPSELGCYPMREGICKLFNPLVGVGLRVCGNAG
jgi:hypothetical protein